MDTYKVTKEFEGELTDQYPVGTIVKMQPIGAKFCRFGLESDEILPIITGIEKFMLHVEKVL